MSEQKEISFEASSIATFTLIQCLLEKLVQNNLLSTEDVRSVLHQSIHLNQKTLSEVQGNHNQDAVYLLEKLSESLELVWQSPSEEA